MSRTTRNSHDAVFFSAKSIGNNPLTLNSVATTPLTASPSLAALLAVLSPESLALVAWRYKTLWPVRKPGLLLALRAQVWQTALCSHMYNSSIHNLGGLPLFLTCWPGVVQRVDNSIYCITSMQWIVFFVNKLFHG